MPRRTVAFWAFAIIVSVAVIDVVHVARSLPRPLFGDEWRYIFYANNLLHGYFSPTDRIFLWNGPAYPLLLAPFVSANWLDGARYANAVFHAFAMAHAWLIVHPRLGGWWSLGAIALVGVYPPIHEHVPLLYTEVFCVFLTTGWIYHSLRAETSRRHLAIAGGYLAVLALTKVVFGVALTCFLVVMFVAWLRRRPSPLLASYVVQAALALVLCLPYLAYTYQLTGRIYYWSSAGPNNFYWLTSPYPEEWGDWYHQGWVNEDPVLRAHHKALFDRTSGLDTNPNLSDEEQVFNMSTPEASDIYLEQGLRNVREHPVKFAKNWLGNVVRLFLDVPVSVRGTPFLNLYSLSHLPLVAWTIFVAVYARRRRVRFPPAWTPIAAFCLIALATYSVTSGTARFLIPLVPLWWLGTCYWLAECRAVKAPPT
ncbi:MAG: hypothetical protein EXQ59_02475 [Acidobacteria bacterium]|nr:hypothetical protein [Acidobacteriota bacterium]